MLVNVRHATTYLYAAPARYSVQSLRLTPLDFDGQRVIDWTVEGPGLDRAARFADAFGNIAHLVSVAEPHEQLTITARGTVETGDRAGLVRGLAETMPLGVWLRETPLTQAGDSLRALAARVPAGPSLERAHALMALLRETVAYEKDVTGARTTAAEVLALGKGVCQDFAHVFIAALRSLRIPARYVTGYLVAGGAGYEAQHAWAEAYIDGLGWVGFDPANATCPTESYVRLACGLDAPGAAPIRGRRQGAGGAGDRLEISVDVREQGSGEQ